MATEFVVSSQVWEKLWFENWLAYPFHEPPPEQNFGDVLRYSMICCIREQKPYSAYYSADESRKFSESQTQMKEGFVHDYFAFVHLGQSIDKFHRIVSNRSDDFGAWIHIFIIVKQYLWCKVYTCCRMFAENFRTLHSWYKHWPKLPTKFRLYCTFVPRFALYILAEEERKFNPNQQYVEIDLSAFICGTEGNYFLRQNTREREEEVLNYYQKIGKVRKTKEGKFEPDEYLLSKEMLQDIVVKGSELYKKYKFQNIGVKSVDLKQLHYAFFAWHSGFQCLNDLEKLKSFLKKYKFL